MKPVLILLTALLFACSTKKTETSSAPIDSVVVDSTIADTPAPAQLAFGPLDGFTAKKNLALPDSINYFHLTSQEALDQRLMFSGTAGVTTAPDFIINYVVAVACAPSKRAATIAMDKVVTGESSIDVYLIVTRGEEGKAKVAPVQVFAIERREGYPVMQFYVNGKKDKALVLVENH